jgi:hypothetical protein
VLEEGAGSRDTEWRGEIIQEKGADYENLLQVTYPLM